MDDDGQIVMNYHAYRGKLTNHQIKKAHLGSQTYFRTESIVLTYKAFPRYQHSISRAWLGYLCFLLSRGFVVVFIILLLNIILIILIDFCYISLSCSMESLLQNNKSFEIAE